MWNRARRCFTDAWVGYTGIDPEYSHNVIDHAEKYAEGRVHVNGIENFWSLLKRGIKGTYVSVEPLPSVSLSRRAGIPLQQAQAD